MQGLSNLKMRLRYQGGIQQSRMQNDKLNGLRKALLYSYQAATLVTPQGLQFRCLINPNKNSTDYDNKILSIPYQDVCVNDKPQPLIQKKTTDAMVKTNLHPGDVFIWKQTNTKWIIYLQYLEQDAYFRAQIRKCEAKANINGILYDVYVRGPDETTTVWNQKAGIQWNGLNYSLVMYITKDTDTLSVLKRHAIIKVTDSEGRVNSWKVVGVNPYSGDGIIQVMLQQYYQNRIAQAVQEEREEQRLSQAVDELSSIQIVGPDQMDCYGKATFTIYGLTGGKWYQNEDSEQYYLGNTDTIAVETIGGKAKTFKLIYKTDTQSIDKTISINAF